MEASPSSSALCPACGKPVDTLRAGQVAILDGAFRYFCDATCKESYVGVSSKRAALDAATVEPPQVIASGTRSAVSGTRPVDEEPMDEEAPPLSTPRFPDPELFQHPSMAPAEVLSEEEALPPETLRSPAAPASTRERGDRVTWILPALGIALGALAAVVSVGGDSAASARLPLALGAAALVVIQSLVRRRDASESPGWVVSAPIVVAAVAITVSRTSDLDTGGYAAFVGLAAAGALLSDLLVQRAQRDVVAARAQTVASLALVARVVRGDEVTEVEASLVKPGEEVVVEAGEVVAVDGVVTAGTAEVAPWAFSPIAMEKREGDAIVAGATVTSGRLRVTATFTGAERAWLRVALPQGQRERIDVGAPLVATARRVVERGVPFAAAIVGGAVYASNGGWIDVVVGACAGAYAVAATTAAFAGALAHARGQVAAQRRGIVYKDANAFEAAARADVAVVCARGTLLLGEPEIVAVEDVSGKGEDPARVLSLAAGAEMGAEGALAQAILRSARAKGARPENVRSAIVVEGLGVTALAQNGDKIIVGGRAFLLKEKVSVAIADARVSELEAEGRSVLLVAVGGRLVGLLALQDGLRQGARAAVQRLHDAHIEPVLLSGEARETCETIARSLDIEHVRPEIMPQDRGAEVRSLGDGGHVVAAIGHASSDDGALGAADVSVAMGSAGAAPGEWGVALASDDVRDAALSLTLPRAARERARTALLVGGAAQVLSSLGIAFGVAPPVVAPVFGAMATLVTLALVRDPVTR